MFHMKYRGIKMTREEAIFCEKSYMGETNCINCNYYGTETCQSRESHRMAVKALEQEPKTGHWIVHPKGIYAHLICDKCLTCAPYDCETNYCPNCGAKMI